MKNIRPGNNKLCLAPRTLVKPNNGLYRMKKYCSGSRALKKKGKSKAYNEIVKQKKTNQELTVINNQLVH